MESRGDGDGAAPRYRRAVPAVTLVERRSGGGTHETTGDLRRPRIERERWDDSVRCTRNGRRSGAEHHVTRFRRVFAWVVVSVLVFMLVATMVLEGIA